jgi:hypothetical protein
MTSLHLARSLERSAFSAALRDSNWGFAILITVHVLALGMFLGTVMVVDLRLIRRAVIGTPISDYVGRLLPWTRGAFAALAVSGLLLFCTEAVKCYESTAFRLKIALILVAGVNIWIFHRKTYRGSPGQDSAPWDESAILPVRARLAGILSLLLWIGALTAGRAVGYNY